jgi:hypothetical protein
VPTRREPAYATDKLARLHRIVEDDIAESGDLLADRVTGLTLERERPGPGSFATGSELSNGPSPMGHCR